MEAEEIIQKQVAATVADEAARKRELRPMEQIRNHYEKVIISMNDNFIKDYDGIKNINLIAFLLEDAMRSYPARRKSANPWQLVAKRVRRIKKMKMIPALLLCKAIPSQCAIAHGFYGFAGKHPRCRNVDSMSGYRY